MKIPGEKIGRLRRRWIFLASIFPSIAFLSFQFLALLSFTLASFPFFTVLRQWLGCDSAAEIDIPDSNPIITGSAPYHTMRPDAVTSAEKKQHWEKNETINYQFIGDFGDFGAAKPRDLMYFQVICKLNIPIRKIRNHSKNAAKLILCKKGNSLNFSLCSCFDKTFFYQKSCGLKWVELSGLDS